jgi:hypothetical protein
MRSGDWNVYSRAKVIFMGGVVQPLLYRLFCSSPCRARQQRESHAEFVSYAFY